MTKIKQAYKLRLYGMGIEEQEKKTNSIKEVEKFIIDSGYPVNQIQSTIKGIEDLEDGWDYELWFPNEYKAIKITVA